MKPDNKILIGLILATVLIFVAGIFLLSRPPKIQTYDQNLLIRENSSKTYSEQPKVIIVEFGDYQCPACASIGPIINQVLASYKDQVGFVFRHFPLPQHKNAIMAAEAVEAAGEQGKYWEMHDILYQKQGEWQGLSDAIPTFVVYAENLQLNKSQFETALKEGKYKEKINNDQKDGVAIGINSTPTFFINGDKFTANPSYANLKLKIDTFLQ